MSDSLKNYIVSVKVHFTRGCRVVDLIICAVDRRAARDIAEKRTQEYGGSIVNCRCLGLCDERLANYVATLRNMSGNIKHVLVSELPSIRDAEKAVTRKITGVPEYRGYRIVEIKETTV